MPSTTADEPGLALRRPAYAEPGAGRHRQMKILVLTSEAISAAQLRERFDLPVDRAIVRVAD